MRWKTPRSVPCIQSHENVIVGRRPVHDGTLQRLPLRRGNVSESAGEIISGRVEREESAGVPNVARVVASIEDSAPRLGVQERGLGIAARHGCGIGREQELPMPEAHVRLCPRTNGVLCLDLHLLVAEMPGYLFKGPPREHDKKVASAGQIIHNWAIIAHKAQVATAIKTLRAESNGNSRCTCTALCLLR